MTRPLRVWIETTGAGVASDAARTPFPTAT